MNTWNAGQIATMIRTLGQQDIEEFGSDGGNQNDLIYMSMNMALWKLARLAYNTEISDTIAITGDGSVSFLKGTSPIANMFEPLRILTITGGIETEVQRRFSDTAPIGWYCESPNQSIDIRGVTGTLKLKYIRYPRQVTLDADPVDMPESGYMTLVYEVLALMKESKNFYQESEAMRTVAKSGYPVITQTAISGRGPSSGGQPPSFDDVKKATGGI